MQKEKEFAFTRNDFDYLRSIVTKTTGIIADEDKYTMYYSRLARRVRKLGLKDFTEYRDYLEKNRETESIELVNAVTTNLTSFFRENHHFEYLRDKIIPEIKSDGKKRLRIWSAGCSTGEEPYSVAITVAEALPDFRQWDIRILATDIDSQVIAKGQSGVYDDARVRDMDSRLLKKYFKRGTGSNSGLVRVDPAIVQLIQFRQLNLLHSWPMTDRMDCIFCRNVVIYFDKETKSKLVNRYADQLKDDGYLFMGHSESLYKSTERFQLLGKTVYRKTGDA